MKLGSSLGRDTSEPWAWREFYKMDTVQTNFWQLHRKALRVSLLISKSCPKSPALDKLTIKFDFYVCFFTIAFWKARAETWLLLLYLGGQGQILEETVCNCASVVMHKDTSHQPHQHNDLQPFVRNWCSIRLVFCFSREWDLNPFAYWGRFYQILKSRIYLYNVWASL